METKVNLEPLGMQVNKREKVLMGVLLTILFFAIVFNLIINPTLELIKNEERLETLKNSIEKEETIKKRLDDISKDRDKLLARYFVDLDQVDILYMLNDLMNDKELTVEEIVFSRPAEIQIEETVFEYVDISIEYTGAYAELIDLIMDLNEESKKLFITTLYFEEDPESTGNFLSGEIGLRAYSY